MKHKAIVSVATTEQYVGLSRRMRRELERIGETADVVVWEYETPQFALPYPYTFKMAAIKDAPRGRNLVLWLDSSIIPLRSLDPIWECIERDGYWFSENWHSKPDWGWSADRSRHFMNSDWTAPEAWPAIAEVCQITPEQNATIPQIVGGAFGLNLKTAIAKTFLKDLERMAVLGGFNGDRSVHRHDQTCMSALVWKMGLKPTVPPAFFADDGQQTEETILISRRGWAE